MLFRYIRFGEHRHPLVYAHADGRWAVAETSDGVRRRWVRVLMERFWKLPVAEVDYRGAGLDTSRVLE